MFSVRIHSDDKALVFADTDTQEQLLLLSSCEFHCGIHSAFTLKLYPWFCMHSGICLVS